MRRGIGTVVLMILLGMPSALEAQASHATGRSLRGGLGAGLIVGDASDFLDGGIGPWLGVERVFGDGDHFGLSVDARWLFLKDQIDLSRGEWAHNDLVVAAVGPLVGVKAGPVRPYLVASVGFLASRWETDGSGGRNVGNGLALAWHGALGLEVALKAGAHPVAFLAESRISDSGEVTFARLPDFMSGDPTGLLRRDIVVLWLSTGVAVGL